MLLAIISGGQTGVDRAALDAAIAVGLAHGGWCPKERRSEDGGIPSCYHLRETSAKAYHVRTSRNVRDSDATLVLLRGRLMGGTLYTIRCATKTGRPVLVVCLSGRQDMADVVAWVKRHVVTVLNIAGPRESSEPGIYQEALHWLGILFQQLAR